MDSKCASLLSRLLRARIHVNDCQIRAVGANFSVRESVVPTPRLVFIESGGALYMVERRALRLRAGSMLLVPARTRRQWRVKGKGRCAAHWIEFLPDIPESLWPPYFLRHSCDKALEVAAFKRVQALFLRRGRNNEPLVLEGEVKALLARFFSEASAGNAPRQISATAGAMEVQRAAEWLGSNYQNPRALQLLARQIEMSANHFRLLFRGRLGMNPQRYLLTLRMRAARSLLQETSMSVKAIAHAAGYTDQLYFSRQYRRFWKATPTENR